MAPLKFEEHIKDKLEQRKLQPSADAWKKLSNRLDADTSNKNTKLFWWLGIAASLVGVLLVVTISMKSDTKTIEGETIVETDAVETILKDDVQTVTDPKVQQDANTVEEVLKGTKKVPTPASTKPNKPSVLKQKIKVESNKLVPTTSNETVAEATKTKIKTTKEKRPTKVLTFEDQAIQVVVAEMQKLQEQNKSSIESELDALLSEAQKEIALDRLYKEAMKSVDADALLRDVEEDLDVSFRDKVFKALQDSYKTVKTAVAERNN